MLSLTTKGEGSDLRIDLKKKTTCYRSTCSHRKAKVSRRFDIEHVVNHAIFDFLQEEESQ